MKIAVLGAAGTRTPLILRAFVAWKERIALRDLALMDVDGPRLALISGLVDLPGLNVVRTTDLDEALAGADFVITTFRVGGGESRVVDERVPLGHGVLGQETTGPGGVAMGLRSVPVLLDVVARMREHCPAAWLINFANPSGMLAEAATRVGGWQRTVGICDAPHGIRRAAATLLGVPAGEVFLDYFGLNHLGWVRAVLHRGQDLLPSFIAAIRGAGGVPGLPFHPELIAALGMIPNEYLHYYTSTEEAVRRILAAGQTRGEFIAALNRQLFADLERLQRAGDLAGMQAAHAAYIRRRSESYMAAELGHEHDPALLEAVTSTGYADVALEVIEALVGSGPKELVLNVPNRGAIHGMVDEDVVEVPAYVTRDLVRPLAAGRIPDHCLGLMKQVKEVERLTIAAAVEHSYDKALKALALHPLVPDFVTARAILDEYRHLHGPLLSCC